MNCKFCGGETMRWGYRKRKLKTGDGAYDILEIPRVRCKTCGKTFTVYENQILPGVHFSKNVVEGKVETYEYPSERTIRRWRKNHSIE